MVPEPLSPVQRSRDVGRRAVSGFQRRVAERMVNFLKQHDPELLGNLAEVGVINRNWIDDPDSGPIAAATPMEVVERMLERSVERRPSLLASLGLSAIQVLSSTSDEDGGAQGLADHLAVVFTDLEGFTSFTAGEGDEAASQLLAAHHRTMGPIVRSRGGRVVKRLGDGLLLTFPEAEAAVLSCLELVDAEPSPLRLRAGIHVGDVVVTRDDVIGHVVNIAARVAESARGGEVLATVDVRAAVAPNLGRVRFGRARRRRFKGIGEPVLVCPVSHASSD